MARCHNLLPLHATFSSNQSMMLQRDWKPFFSKFEICFFVGFHISCLFQARILLVHILDTHSLSTFHHNRYVLSEYTSVKILEAAITFFRAWVPSFYTVLVFSSQLFSKHDDLFYITALSVHHFLKAECWSMQGT